MYFMSIRMDKMHTQCYTAPIKKGGDDMPIRPAKLEREVLNAGFIRIPLVEKVGTDAISTLMIERQKYLFTKESWERELKIKFARTQV